MTTFKLRMIETRTSLHSRWESQRKCVPAPVSLGTVGHVKPETLCTFRIVKYSVADPNFAKTQKCKGVWKSANILSQNQA